MVALLFADSGPNGVAAVTVAIRYATVRRQGNQDSGGLERQIITYPSVYNRLLPILARSYIFILLGRSLVSARFADCTYLTCLPPLFARRKPLQR